VSAAAQLALAFPRARRSDPRTSHDAAARAALTAGSQAARILLALCETTCAWPTAYTLAAATGLTHVQVDRRAIDLERDGWITRTDEGMGALCWWESDKARAWYAERRLP